jgi:predicted PurR-regulated permease PerM
MDKTVLTTIKATATILVIGLVLYVLVQLGPIFATLLLSLFLALAVEPAVEYFEKVTLLNKPLSRGISVVLTYFLLLLSILVILTVGFPPVLAQSQKLLLNVGNLLKNVPVVNQANIPLDSLLPEVSKLSETLLDTTSSVLSGLVWAVSVFFLSLYMSLDWRNLRKQFIGLFAGHLKDVVEKTVREIEINVGAWVKGQLFLMAFIGLISFFGLLVLGIDYPLALGLVAGLLEIIPVLGPTISWILAAIVGFSISPAKGISAVILFSGIQLLENNFLVPKVMGKVSGFRPLVVLIAVLVGGTFFGVLGIILAVPLTMTLVIVIKQVLAYRK